MQRREGLLVHIQIRDEQGNVVGEAEAVSFQGLLALAHDEQLRSVHTRLLQAPSAANGREAIVQSTVRTRRGRYSGIGDANPANVDPRVAPHLIRVAETRATARALRLAVNIGEVALEELGAHVTVERSARIAPGAPLARRPAPESPDHPTRGDAWEGDDAGDGVTTRRPARDRPRMRGRDGAPEAADPSDGRRVSEEQKKLLFRLALQLGETRESAERRLLGMLGASRWSEASRAAASRAIDALKGELARPSSGTARSNGAHPDAH